jgi:hypothetical protein
VVSAVAVHYLCIVEKMAIIVLTVPSKNRISSSDVALNTVELTCGGRNRGNHLEVSAGGVSRETRFPNNTSILEGFL